jgi:hypothetical protein
MFRYRKAPAAGHLGKGWFVVVSAPEGAEQAITLYDDEAKCDAEVERLNLASVEAADAAKGVTAAKAERDLFVTDAMIEDSRQNLAANLSLGTYTPGFLRELAAATFHRMYNVHSILSEIRCLEGLSERRSSTKPAARFTGRLLNGLWHKHHSQAEFLPANMQNEMHRDSTVHRVLEPHMGEILTEELWRRLTHTLVIENIERRSCEGRLTGEWIVFAKQGSVNHYLTLASHTDGDEAILERITVYEVEFAALGILARTIPAAN